MEKPFNKITETDSLYDDLESKSIGEILGEINAEDHKVAPAVKAQLPAIERLLVPVVDALLNGGRLFYIGAGTSGRLGILDASECPPTFGVPQDLIIGLIAGGDDAIRNAVEFAEDNTEGAWHDLQQHQITQKDVVIGIAASGTTPYVLGGIKKCNEQGIFTGGITCNPGSPLAEEAQFPIVVEVGPEYVTGSSRMKAGTAQKMVLNCITTTAMIQLGRIKGNKMVDMQLSNYKLKHRGLRIIQQETQCDTTTAQRYLEKYGSVRVAIEMIKSSGYA